MKKKKNIHIHRWPSSTPEDTKKKKRNLGIPYTAQNLFFLKTQPSHPHKKKRKEAAF